MQDAGIHTALMILLIRYQRFIYTILHRFIQIYATLFLNTWHYDVLQYVMGYYATVNYNYDTQIYIVQKSTTLCYIQIYIRIDILTTKAVLVSSSIVCIPI